MNDYQRWRMSQMGTGPAPQSAPDVGTAMIAITRLLRNKNTLDRADLARIPGAAHALREFYMAGLIFRTNDGRIGKVSVATLAFYRKQARGLSDQLALRDKLAQASEDAPDLMWRTVKGRCVTTLAKVPGIPGHKPLHEQVAKLVSLYQQALARIQQLEDRQRTAQESIGDPVALLAATVEAGEPAQAKG